MDNIALILVLIPIAILGLLVFGLTRKMDFLIRKISTPDRRAEPRNTLDSFLLTQRHWSAKTFGLGTGRWRGIVAHVEKELREIEHDPLDLEEWIDVIILGFDGAWRTGATDHAIISALFAKQAKNRTREWIVSEDEGVPAEHVGPRSAPFQDSPRRISDVIFRNEATPPPTPTSIDIFVYAHKVTGKWVVQVGSDTSRLAQFESEEAAKQYARQTGEVLKMQMASLVEDLKADNVAEAVLPRNLGGKSGTNLRRLSPEDMQRVLTDPEAYAEWRGVCGLENDPSRPDGKVKDAKLPGPEKVT